MQFEQSNLNSRNRFGNKNFKCSNGSMLVVDLWEWAKKKIKKITVMIHSILTDEQIINLYLDYRNNFLTPEGFGLHYGLDYDEYMIILDKGRELLG